MYDKDISSVCPICNKAYTGRPAVSRIDNTTLICPDCGIREALGSIGTESKEIEKIIQIIHQIHNRGENTNG